MVMSFRIMRCHCVNFSGSLAERRVTCNEAKLVVEGDGREDDEPPLDKVTGDLSAVENNVEDDLDLPNIPPSGAIDVWSVLLHNFCTINENCCLFGLNVPVSTGGVFRTVLRGLKTVGEHLEALE